MVSFFFVGERTNSYFCNHQRNPDAQTLFSGMTPQDQEKKYHCFLGYYSVVFAPVEDASYRLSKKSGAEFTFPENTPEEVWLHFVERVSPYLRERLTQVGFTGLPPQTDPINDYVHYDDILGKVLIRRNPRCKRFVAALMEGQYIRLSIPTRFSFIAAVKSLEMNRASLLQSLSREGFKPDFSGYEFKRPETPPSRISEGIVSHAKANPKSEYPLSEKNGKKTYTDPILGEVEVRVSPGTKRISLRIDRGSYVILSLPSLSKLEDGVKFLESKRPWIEKTRSRISSKRVLVPKEILSDRNLFFDTLFENRTPLLERADYLAEMLGTKPSSVEVDFYKSKWGKCDIGGAIMLNFATNLLPAYLRDSVIIHEMTHLTYMNHGDGFHDLMEQYLQKYFALEINRLSEEFPDRKAPGESDSEERVKDWEHYRLLSDLYLRSKKSRAIRPFQKTINDDLKKFSIV